MGTLYVVATPIGNTKDITLNALDILKNVDMIACEDTRTSGLLLSEYKISNKLVSYHKFNENTKSDYLIEELLAGKDIAVISDAGTPCINDPGSYIVHKAVLNNINVIPVCGASAVISSLSISGFTISSFSFYGFIPRVNKDVNALFDNIRNSNAELFVLYESPKRIKKSLELIDEGLDNPEICVCNDLTKKYQRIYRGSTKEVIKKLNENKNSEKGEYVLIIKKIKEKSDINNIDITLEAQLVNLMVQKDCSLKDAIKELNTNSEFSKNEIYNASLNLKKLI